MNEMDRMALYRWFVSAFHHGDSPVPVSAHDLDEAERALDTLFPWSYRAFMGSFGELYTPDLFQLAPGLPEMPDLKNIASLSDVVSETPACWSAGTPSNLVVIGNDVMGNLFCLPRLQGATERPDDLPVEFFDHEFLHVAEIAPSFDGWLTGYLQLQKDGR